MKKNVRKIILLCIIILITIVLCNITNIKRYISKNEDKQILPEDEMISSKIEEKENFFDTVYEKTEDLVNEERSSNNVSSNKANYNIKPHIDEKTGVKYITYEDFETGSSETEDCYQKIKEAHEYANSNNYEVRATSKVYNIYKLNDTEPILIKTNTNWNNAKFIIHDENIKDFKAKDYPIFKIASNDANKIITDQNVLKEIKLNRNTNKLKALAGYGDCICIAYNEDKIQYIRYNYENSGISQRDIFKIDNDGNILNDIQWDFDEVTKIMLIPIPKEQIVVENGIFQTNLPNDPYEQETGYFNRNIVCNRSNTIIKNIKHTVNNNDYIGGPYFGFIKLSYVADVNLMDCELFSHKYNSKSSYDLILEYTVNINVENVKSNDIDDNSRWGITGTNYTKDVIYKNCELNRIDAHSGVHNLTIENSILGRYGITVVGSGNLNIDNVTTLSPSTLVYLRNDYGSTWNGTINIKNCTMSKAINPQIVTFYTNYDNNNQLHNYGYDLYLPNIIIDGLTINDSSNVNSKYPNICVFNNIPERTGTDNGDMRNNYKLPQSIDIKDYQTTSGRKMKLFSTKFYDNLKDTGINLSVPLKDKNEVTIKDEDNNQLDENAVINKPIKIYKNSTEGINTTIKVNGQTMENETEEISQDGVYNVDVIYQNDDDVQKEKHNFIIDETSPSIFGVEQGKTYTHKVYPTIEDENLEKVEISINGTIKEVNLENGLEEEGIYRIVATDKAGNSTEISFQIVEPSDDDYKFRDDKILNISAGTNQQEFMQKLNIDENYKILRNTKELDKNENIATGDVLKLKSGQEYNLIVKGDVNSDGIVNIKDIIELRKYLLMGNNLNENEKVAADTDLDERTIGIKDLVRMRILVLTQGIM